MAQLRESGAGEERDPHAPSGNHQRKLQYHNRTRRGCDGKQSLRDSCGNCFVSRVHSLWARLFVRMCEPAVGRPLFRVVDSPPRPDGEFIRAY